MKVRMGRADEQGCGHYRVLNPGRAAAATGEVEVDFPEGVTGVTILTFEDGTQRVTRIPAQEVDVLVIQRPMRQMQLDIISLAQAQGVAVVVDVDDDISCLHPKHSMHRLMDPRTNPVANYQHLAKACSIADMVTVTTPALAQRYGGHGRVAVLPNCIPKSYLGALPFEERDGRTVGWAGTVRTHPTDLKATRGGVARALRETGARFMSIGNQEEVREQLELYDETEFVWAGAAKISEYPDALAQLDVGLAPLDDIAFNRAKSALKGLEMAAVGVPFVASAVPDYVRVARQGIGWLAKSKTKDWHRSVRDLLRNERARHELELAGRSAVVEHHLQEDNAWRWIEVWEHATRVRPQRPVVLTEDLAKSS